MKTKVLACGAIARCGKDSAFSILQKYLPVERVAFADALKIECNDLCVKNLGISCFTSKDEEKDIIRPILVEFGCAVRKLNKRAWIEKSHNKIISILKNNKIPVITDVRFDSGDGDEASYIQKELGGVLINIDRIVMWDGTVPILLAPANSTEAANYPKIKARADINLMASNLEELEREIVAKILPLFQ